MLNRRLIPGLSRSRPSRTGLPCRSRDVLRDDSFGLVSIPVKVYPASRSKRVHFNMLHAKDRSRLKQQAICATCGEVERDETVRGYDTARPVRRLTDEELRPSEEDSRSRSGVRADRQGRPDYFEKSQLLGPDKGGAKAYRLLNEAMITMGRRGGRHRARDISSSC
jgi:DNA end-binding protein Ku